MAALTSYAVASAAVLVLLVLGAGWLVEPEEVTGLWVSAGVAFVVQLAAFGALVAGRRRGWAFVVSWASGMMLRLAVVAGMAFWVTRETVLDPAVALVSLIGFVFVLVLLEPLFLRLAD